MPEPKRPLKVFLCHASTDKPKVRELYRYLKKRGIQPWFDEEDLVGGQDWQVEIPKALATSDAIIICLTKNSVDKEGYIQKEIKFALDKALEMPEGRIFLIPVKFDECEVPFTLSRYQWVDLTVESGYAKMMKALKFHASQLERSTVEISKKDVEEENLVREKKEREASELAERERREKELREKQARESSEKEKSETENKDGKSVNVKPKAGGQIAYWFGGFIFLVLGIIFLSLLNNPLFTLLPTSENTQTETLAALLQDTVEPSATVIPKLTSTPVSTPTPLVNEITDNEGIKMELVSGDGIVTFYMDKFEVTNALYKACVSVGVCATPVNTVYFDQSNYINHPVVYITQDMARSYCDWRESRLPTYKEWEAASVGFPWEKIHDCDYANYASVIIDSVYPGKFLYCVGTSTPVGSYELGKSEFNIYDLIGNVAEWSYEDDNVLGGSWSSYNKIEYSRRLMSTDDNNRPMNASTVGFRCIRDSQP